MSKKLEKIILILDNIRSRENVGSIFRTADAVGVSKIYLCGITPCPPHEKIAKASLGAENSMVWEYIKDTWRLVDILKKEGYNVVALEQVEESVGILKYKPKFPLALVMGNEVNGVSKSVLDRVDKKIFIPMYGQKESLNVSVATGVALYLIKK